MSIERPGKISSQLIRRYLPYAYETVFKHERLIDPTHRQENAMASDAEMLAALFAHLRIEPHAAPIKDFDGELEAVIKERRMKTALEIGGGLFPFERLLPRGVVGFYTFDQGNPSDSTPDSGKGNMHRDLNSWNAMERFDLVFSMGVQCTGYDLEDFESVVKKHCRTAKVVVGRLSDHPYAAYFASSWMIDVLAFTPNLLGKSIDLIAWHETNERESLSGMAHSWIMRECFDSPAATLAVLAKKAKLQ